MPRKKQEVEVEEFQIPEGCVEISPEQFAELQGGNMQTILSIGLAERLWIEDRHDRILYLDGEIDSEILHKLIMQIAKINGEDYGIPSEERVPITLIINSNGGEDIIGMALVNVIQTSATPVIGVCLGLCASMAFGIFAVCHTRLAVKDAVFMVHDGSIYVADNVTKVKDYMKFQPKLDERYNRAIASRTKFTMKELDESSPHDNWFFADELVDMGMVDGIIGQDVALEEVFAFMSESAACDCEEVEDEE